MRLVLSAVCLVALLEILNAAQDAATVPIANAALGTITPSRAIFDPPRADLATVLLSDGKVLIAGGSWYDGQVRSVGAAYLYDPRVDSMSPIRDMALARGGAVATTLRDGRVLITGGADYESRGGKPTPVTTAEIYDPSTATFSPPVNMGGGRMQHGAALLANGKVLVAGGLEPSPPSPYALDSVATTTIFDPATSTFTAGPRMARPRGWPTMTLLSSGQILVVSDGTAELYDPRTNRFSATKPMTETRMQHTATKLNDGTVLLVGGGLGSSRTATAGAEIYRADTGTFTKVGSLQTARMNHSATLLDDGRVLIAGGELGTADGHGTLTSTEIYDPQRRAFEPGPEMGTPRTRHQATRLTDGAVWISGGTTSRGNGIVWLRSSERFQPAPRDH